MSETQSHGDAAVEATEANREDIGLSDKDAAADVGEPNNDGGEPTRTVVPQPREASTENV